MRLTLRTLLSYLDDTLEPAQAKLIGAKVAESEQARELMERIRQVTRRRRLMTPPPSGPGGIDANTIAEYMDNDVTPEQAAEVEQICLASDVHLAEVAACHQILTLVLGEPALVPPSAKQRMYALVKGPEAIHARKPAKSVAMADQDLSSELEPDEDETLRLGVPAVGGKNDRRNLYLMIGGGVLAASLLVVAVWMIVHDRSGPGEPKGNQIAQGDGKDQKKEDGPKDDDKKKLPEPKDKKEEKIPPPKKVDPTQEFKPEVVEVPIPKAREMPYLPASGKQVPVAQYIEPSIKEPGVLLQLRSDKSGWTRIRDKKDRVFSGRPLMSLPGSKCTVKLDSDVDLTLWGNLVELTLDPLLAESRATVHVNDQLDADLTLHRGRIILRNTKKDGRDAALRVRFDNPTVMIEEHFDITLNSDSAAIVERFCELDRDEPFYEDPKDLLRKGPTAYMRIYAYAGTLSVRMGGETYLMDEKQLPIMQWQSGKGTFASLPGPLPPWLRGTPPLKDKNDLLAREKAVRAHEAMAALLDTKQVDVALAEVEQTVQLAAQKELVSSQQISVDTFALWRQAIRCAAAVDDVGYLFDEFAQEKTPSIVRGLCMQTLHQWIGLGRENDYELLAVLRKNYKKTEATKIAGLLHKVSTEAARDPITYQNLIEGLNNELLPIRILSHWHLWATVPAGQKILYDPAAPRQARQEAQKAWMKLIPPGQLPPTGAPMK